LPIQISLLHWFPFYITVNFLYAPVQVYVHYKSVPSPFQVYVHNLFLPPFKSMCTTWSFPIDVYVHYLFLSRTMFCILLAPPPPNFIAHYIYDLFLLLSQHSVRYPFDSRSSLSALPILSGVEVSALGDSLSWLVGVRVNQCFMIWLYYSHKTVNGPNLEAKCSNIRHSSAQMTQHIHVHC
jgi:hypothetical protein